jgi:hypothetical protein
VQFFHQSRFRVLKFNLAGRALRPLLCLYLLLIAFDELATLGKLGDAGSSMEVHFLQYASINSSSNSSIVVVVVVVVKDLLNNSLDVRVFMIEDTG